MNAAPDEAMGMALALESGAIALSEVVSWADDQIRHTDTADSELIDLSLAKGIPQAIGLLHQIAKESNAQAAARFAFRHLLRALKGNVVDHAKVAKSLERMAYAGVAPNEDARNQMYTFDDQLQLALDRHYGDPKTVRAELEDFLAAYAT